MPVPRFARTLIVVPLLLAPLAAHLALLTHRGMGLAGVLVATQASIVAWIGLAPLRRDWLRAIGAGVVFALVVVLWRFAGDGVVLASAIPHAMACSALLVFFLSSLAPGRVAVITGIARRSRGTLSPSVERYTRRITMIWSGFFAAQLIASLALLLFASPDAWSLFVNLCNLPSIVVLLVGEYCYRQRYHAADPPERLVDMIRVFRSFRADLAHEDR